MRKLFWIGSPFFSHSLRRLGWDVRVHNFEHLATYDWHDIVRIAGWKPDVVVVADKSRPPFVLGQEAFPCTTVFYAVDTHIHSWLPLYAQSFDLCLVSLRDDMHLFQTGRLGFSNVFWSPPFALSSIRPAGRKKKWGCLFVGTINKDTTPKRAEFITRLARELPELQVTRGPYADLYSHADVILNICEHGDLNFRVFEALGCGCCLVTPHVGHGQSELFQDGRDLFCYPSFDVAEATKLIRKLIADPLSRERAAQTGLARVDASHRDIHRAEALDRILQGVSVHATAERLKNAEIIHAAWLREIYLLLASAISNSGLKLAYLEAAKKYSSFD